MALDFTLLSIAQVQGLKLSELLNGDYAGETATDVRPLEVLKKHGLLKSEGEHLILTLTNALQLDVLKKYGTLAAPTDLAKLLGAAIDESGWMVKYRSPENELVGNYWTLSAMEETNVYLSDVTNFGTSYCDPRVRTNSVRPILSANQTCNLRPLVMKTIAGITTCEYGEYPQYLAPEPVSQELEQSYQKGLLATTGKNYTFDQHVHNYKNKSNQTDLKIDFQPDPHAEYTYKDKQYIRVRGISRGSMEWTRHDCTLSSGKHIENQAYWIEVKPIEWLVDPSGVWVSKKSLLSGIQFDTERTYDGHFDHTFLKRYLDAYFAKEIEPFPPHSRIKQADADILKVKAQKIAEQKAQIRARRDKVVHTIKTQVVVAPSSSR